MLIRQNSAILSIQNSWIGWLIAVPHTLKIHRKFTSTTMHVDYTDSCLIPRLLPHCAPLLVHVQATRGGVKPENETKRQLLDINRSSHQWTMAGQQHVGMGVYFRWNGMVEWNSGMDYWNGGMLHRTYLIIQHVLYSEQWALRCVLCMHCWTHSPKCGCWALTCPHRAHKKANARAIVTELFSLSDCTHTVCEKGKMTICNQV